MQRIVKPDKLCPPSQIRTGIAFPPQNPYVGRPGIGYDCHMQKLMGRTLYDLTDEHFLELTIGLTIGVRTLKLPGELLHLRQRGGVGVMLLTLQRPAQLTQADIAQIAGMSRSACQRLCETLLRRGYLTYAPHALDGRKQLLVPAAKGWKMLRDLYRHVGPTIRKISRERIAQRK
jgi:DNA-binding MarR family transcriptional regulator